MIIIRLSKANYRKSISTFAIHLNRGENYVANVMQFG